MLKRLTHWFSQPSKPQKRRTALRLERLDERAVPAAGPSLNGYGQLCVEGTPGNDVVQVQQMDNSIRVNFDGQSTDFAAAKVRSIVFRGRDGDDSFANNTTLRASAWGGKGNDTLSGGSANDVLWGEAGDDSLMGGSGNDSVHGGQGADDLVGGSGNDDLQGNDGDDDLEGDDGSDRMNGGNGSDDILGGNGNDSLRGGQGLDDLSGDSGNDDLNGDNGDDSLLGGAGDDVEHGGSGNDDLSGGAGNDRVFGDAGNDRMRGDLGRDFVSGGWGRDQSVEDQDDGFDDCDESEGQQVAEGVAKVEGSITALGTDSIEITTKSGAVITVTVDANTKFERNGAHSTFADLQVGDAVEAKYNPDTLVAFKVETGADQGDDNDHAGKVEGMITALTADSVTIKSMSGQPVTIQVNTSTKLERNGRHVAFSEFQVGDAAEAKFDPATMIATKLEAVSAN